MYQWMPLCALLSCCVRVWGQVKALARLSLKDPEYIAVHADAAAPTPVKLRQVRPRLSLLALCCFCRPNICTKMQLPTTPSTGVYPGSALPQLAHAEYA